MKDRKRLHGIFHIFNKQVELNTTTMTSPSFLLICMPPIPLKYIQTHTQTHVLLHHTETLYTIICF